MFSTDSCNLLRGKMEHPEKYTCQVFTSAKSTAWTYTPPGAEVAPSPPQEDSVQPDVNTEHHSFNDGRAASSFAAVQVGPSGYLSEKDSPYIEHVPPPAAADPTLPTKRVVRKQSRQHQQFDPIGAIASLFTPRDW